MSSPGPEGTSRGLPVRAAAAGRPARLRDARERLGLSVRELARQTGIPAATISAIEQGREPRWSTLVRYLETVPGLRAAELVAGPRFHPPVMSLGAWRWFARAIGFHADETRETLRALPDGGARLELVITGLLSTCGDVPSQDLPGALVQAACMAQPLFVSRLAPEPDATSLVARDGDVEHAFEWSLDPVVMTYRRTEILARLPERLVHRQAVATRNLILGFDAGAGPAPPARLLAWTRMRDSEGDDASIAPHVHAPPHQPAWHREGSLVAASVEHVLPDMTHALAWDVPDAPALPAPPESFAPIARALRDRAGMSARELAHAMGSSHGTVLEAEAGRDPRAGTLERYLRAVPDASAQWLLPALEAGGELTHDEAWEWQRELHGLEAERMVVDSIPRPDGRVVRRQVIDGLRSLEPTAGRVGVALRAFRGLFNFEPGTLESIETSFGEDDESEVLVQPLEAGGRITRLLLPGRLSSAGCTLTVTYANPDLGRRGTRAELLERHGPETVVRGSKTTVTVPTGELAFRLIFPRGLEADEFWPVAYHETHPPRPFRHGSLLERVHREGVTWSLAEDRSEARLAIRRPLCGVSYGFAWAIHLGEPWHEPRATAPRRS